MEFPVYHDGTEPYILVECVELITDTCGEFCVGIYKLDPNARRPSFGYLIASTQEVNRQPHLHELQRNGGLPLHRKLEPGTTMLRISLTHLPANKPPVGIVYGSNRTLMPVTDCIA